MEKLIEELRATSSGNEKIAILKRYADDNQIKEAFRLCYDPFILTHMKKVSTVVQQDAKSFAETFSIFQPIFHKLSTRQVTGNAAISLVTDFLSTCTEDTQKVYIQILKKDMKCGVSSATLSKIWGKDFLKKFEVQLAKKYDEEEDYGTDYWFINKKLDGLRCIFIDDTLFTRGGNEVIGFDHVYEEVRDLCKRYSLDFVDGELYSPDIPFQTIQGYVLSYKNINDDNKKKILYNIFVTGRSSLKTTEEMVDILKNVEWWRYKYIKSVYTVRVKNDPREIFKIAEKYIEQGSEGAMLRHPTNWYSWKRDNNLLKVKFFEEAEFEIVGFYEGTRGSKNEGKLGGFYVKGDWTGRPGPGEPAGTFKVLSDCGGGISDELRESIWANQSAWFGKKIEVKFQNLTEERADGTCALRFPNMIPEKKDR